MASVSVLVTTSPLFIAVLGFVFLRERLKGRTVAAIVVAVAGATLIGLGDPGGESFPQAWVGNTLALTAALLVAVYMLIGRAVRQRTSFLAYLFPLYTATALTCLAAALIRGVPLAQPWPIIALCFAMGLISSVIGHGSINYAVKFFPAAILGLLTLAEPVIASGIALVLFAEVPGPVALVGMAIVLSSLVVVFLPRLRR